MARRHRVLVLAASGVLASALAAGCGPGGLPTGGPSAGGQTSVGGGWLDQQVSFTADGMTVYGTFRHPADSSMPVPAVLLIAGSGPTDRDGNSEGEAGQLNTLSTVAGWLSDDGVASLRYDKLGSGQTGLGSYAGHPQDIDLTPYEHEAAAALTFLADQPGMDKSRLGVFGHSEGARYALLLATGKAGNVPPIHDIGLLEPGSLRAFDQYGEQIRRQVAIAAQAGQLTPEQAQQIRTVLSQTISTLREGGSLPPNLPAMMTNVFNPANIRYSTDEDRYDPAGLASELPAHMPVLVTCSDADIQITCADVAHLRAGLTDAATDFVTLHGVDHVLKQDDSRTGANYTKPLPFSTQLQQAVHDFTSR